MRRIRRLITYSLALVTLLAYASALVPPEAFGVAGLMTLLTPILLLLNGLLLVIGVRRRSWLVVVPLLVLVAGLPFLRSTFSYHPPATVAPDFSVLSYNVQVFRRYEYPRGARPETVNRMINWVADHPADILCLQEFYYESRRPDNALARIAAQREAYFAPWHVDKGGNSFGMAIFSRFPIRARGVVTSSTVQNNLVVYADVETPGGLLRVYNVHLESNRISNEAFGATSTRAQARSIARRLVSAFDERTAQLRQLEANMAACPYPVVVCGDLNDLPYGYVYHRLGRRLTNAFEAAGRGFGFTYRGRIPFLRIDNQFVDERFDVIDFRTHRDVAYSDHYPISAGYAFPTADPTR